MPVDLPPLVGRVLRRCLERDPRQRLRDIGEARIGLEETLAGRGSEQGAAGHGATRRTRAWPEWLPWAVAAAAVVTLVLTSLAGRDRRREAGAAPPAMARRAAIEVPGLGDVGSSSASLYSLSGDGSLLLYATTVRGSTGTLHARRLDALTATPIPGTTGAQAAFVSPDGRTVGFLRGSEMFVVPVTGGALTRVRGAAFLAEGRPAWTPDGRIVYTSNRGELVMVRPDGSSPEVLTRPQPPERHLSPFVLPTGQTLLFTAVGTDVSQARIEALSLRDHRSRPLVSDGAMTPQYAQGHLLYVRPDRTLMAVAFDSERAELAGEPLGFPDRVNRTRFGVANYVAASGTIVYAPSSQTRLVEISRDGRRETLLAEEGSWHHPRYSPDGSRIVVDRFSAGGAERDVWTLDRATRTLSRVTRVGDAHDASWLPNGREVSFFSFRAAHGPLMIAAADGGTEPRAVAIGPGFTPSDLVNPGGWLSDGSAYLGGVRDRGGPSDVWRVPREGGVPVRLLGSLSDELAPSASPDRRWLAYLSDETGRSEVYVKSLEGTGRAQISNAGGSEPVWDPHGEVLYYIEADADRRRLVAARLRTAPTLTIRDRKVVFEDLRLDESDNHPNYDVDRSGTRFLLPEIDPSPALVAVFDWQAELRNARLSAERRKP